MKNVLMIAYAFPPFNFSGTARPFGFAKHLPAFGWHPTVLTRQGTAGFAADDQMLSDLAGNCDIVRVLSGDNDDWLGWLKQQFRYLNLPMQKFGFKPHYLAQGLSWRLPHWFPGIKDHIHWGRPLFSTACKLIKQKHFDLIWATGDPWSSIITGYQLSKIFNVPFIADIRDPWTYGVMWNPATPRIAKWNQMWEQKVLTCADRTVFTSPLTRDIYRQRVKNEFAPKLISITNGFDQFDNMGTLSIPESPDQKCRFYFVGNLTTNRNPQVLLEGFKRACQSIGPDQISLQFIGRVSPYERFFDSSFVEHTPPVSQDISRQYMRSADVLILLQASMTAGADVISGKAYEYLAAQKPILGVVPENGGDAWLINETNAGTITGTTDPEKIAQAIVHFWKLWKDKKLVSPVTPDAISRFSRYNLTRELADLFDQVLASKGRPTA